MKSSLVRSLAGVPRCVRFSSPGPHLDLDGTISLGPACSRMRIAQLIPRPQTNHRRPGLRSSWNGLQIPANLASWKGPRHSKFTWVAADATTLGKRLTSAFYSRSSLIAHTGPGRGPNKVITKYQMQIVCGPNRPESFSPVRSLARSSCWRGVRTRTIWKTTAMMMMMREDGDQLDCASRATILFNSAQLDSTQLSIQSQSRSNSGQRVPAGLLHGGLLARQSSDYAN